MSIQVWQHRNSGNKYIVDVDNGIVNMAELVLTIDYFPGVIEAGDDWDFEEYGSKQVAHWLNETTDEYRVIWPFRSA